MIHFHLGRFFGTVKDTYGIALAEKDGLRLTFHSEDEDEVDIMDTDVEEVVIPWTMIQKVSSKKGFLESEITILLSRLFSHKDLPISKNKELVLDTKIENLNDPGPIGFQLHGNVDMEIRVKDLIVRSL